MTILRSAAGLVSSKWLQQQLGKSSKNFKLFDASWSLTKGGQDDYAGKHIKGAGFLDLNQCIEPKPDLARPLPNAACLEDYLQMLGISQDNHVVLYDRGGMASAARAWWMLRAYGFSGVSVLNGGLAAWESEGNEIVEGVEKLPEKKGDFKVQIQGHLIKHFEEFKADIIKGGTQILDARNPAHFLGQDEEPTPSTINAFQGVNLPPPTNMIQGHVKGAQNFQTNKIQDEETKLVVDQPELLKVFDKHGVSLYKPTITMCYNGNAASLLALGAYEAGRTDVAVYYGSWSEFGIKGDESLLEKTSGNVAA